MGARALAPWLIVGGLAGGLVGCRKNPTPQEQEAEMKRHFETRVGDPKFRGAAFALAPTPVAPAAANPGPAFLYMDDVGVLKLDATGAPSFIDAKLGSAHRMVATPAGALFVLAGSDLWTLPAEGTTFTKLATDAAFTYGQLALAPDGAVWVATCASVRAWTGTAWNALPGSPCLGEERSVRSLVIDGANRPYLSTTRMIMVFDGGAWKPVWDIRELYVDGMYPMPEGSPLLIGAQPTLIAGHGRGTLTFDGKDLTVALRPLDAKYLAGPMALHRGDLVAMSAEHVVWTPLAGGPDKVAMPTPQAPFSTDAVLDAGGRAWMWHRSGGFTVADATGAVKYIPPGGLPELHAQVTAIAVAGAGPTKLPDVVEVARGSIKGIIVRGGAPVANAPVEVCRYVAKEFRADDSPCKYSSGRATGVTDASGAFQIDDLPLLDYGLAAEVDGQWYGIQARACGKGLAADAVCDLGALDIGGT